MKNNKTSAVRTALIAILVLLLLTGAAGLVVRLTKQEDPQGPPDADAPVVSEKLELDKSELIF